MLLLASPPTAFLHNSVLTDNLHIYQMHLNYHTEFLTGTIYNWNLESCRHT